MKRKYLLDIAFIFGILLLFYGVTQKIMHNPAANTWLLLGGICWIAFLAIALFEVSSSHRAGGTEKTLWILGLLLASGITGFLYVLWGRGRVRNQRQMPAEDFSFDQPA